MLLTYSQLVVAQEAALNSELQVVEDVWVCHRSPLPAEHKVSAYHI